MRAKRFLIAAMAWSVPLALLLLATPAGAKSVPAWVVEVHDGDTFTALGWFGQEQKLRLACADTPEMESTRWKRQPYALEAQQHAEGLVADRWVATERVSNSYGRDVVHLRNRPWTNDLAASLVEAGLAWATVDYPYCRAKAAKLRDLEAQARAAGRGLWADPNPCPPSKWRKGKCK